MTGSGRSSRSRPVPLRARHRPLDRVHGPRRRPLVDRCQGGRRESRSPLDVITQGNCPSLAQRPDLLRRPTASIADSRRRGGCVVRVATSAGECTRHDCQPVYRRPGLTQRPVRRLPAADLWRGRRTRTNVDEGFGQRCRSTSPAERVAVRQDPRQSEHHQVLR